MNLDFDIRRIRVVAGLTFLSLLCRASAEDAPLIPRSAFFSPATATVRLSPDGSRLAFGHSDAGLTVIQAVRGKDAGQTETPIQLRGVLIDVQWAYTNHHLIVTRRTQNGTEIVSRNVETGDETVLSKNLGPRVAVAALNPALPETVVLRSFGEDATDALWRVTFRGEKPEQLAELKHDEIAYFDATLTPRVLSHKRNLCETVLLCRNKDGEWREFRTMACDYTNLDGGLAEGTQRILGVNADGSKVYLVDNTGRDKAALFAIDLETKNERVLAESDDADISANVLTDAISGDPLAAYAQFGDRRRNFLDSAAEAAIAAMEKQAGCQIEIVQRSLDGNIWLVIPLDGGPDTYHLYDRERGTMTELFPRYGAMKGFVLAERTAYLVKTADGVTLPCHVYVPRDSDKDADGKPDAPLPTLLYVHGGPSDIVPWDDWNGHSVRAQQLLANRGYAAIRVEFRGAGGLGNKFREAGYREWAGKSLDDIVAVADWAIAQGIADPKRIGIWGFSHGGYATLAALAWHADTFACGFAWSAPAAFDAWIDNPGLADYIEILASRYGDPRTPEGLELLRKQSPLYCSERIVDPLLVVQGGNDRPVPPARHADPLVAQLTAQGLPVTYASYGGEGHGFSRAASWVSAWAIAERFFAQHLGGRYEDFGDDLTRGTKLDVKAGIQYIDGLADALN